MPWRHRPILQHRRLDFLALKLESVTSELERLAENGYRLAPKLVEEIRILAGE